MSGVRLFHVDCVITLRRVYVFFDRSRSAPVRFMGLGVTAHPNGAWATRRPGT